MKESPVSPERPRREPAFPKVATERLVEAPEAGAAPDAVRWPRSGRASPRSEGAQPRFTASRSPRAEVPSQRSGRTGWRAAADGPPGAGRRSGRGPQSQSPDAERPPPASPAVQGAAAVLQPAQRPWIEAVAAQLGEAAAVELAAALAQPATTPAKRRLGGPLLPRTASRSAVRQGLLEEALRQIVDRTPVGGALLEDVREEIRHLDRLNTARSLR